jgi:hypothetical protein
MKIKTITYKENALYVIFVDNEKTFYYKQNYFETQVYMTNGSYPKDDIERVLILDENSAIEYEALLGLKEKEIKLLTTFNKGNNKAFMDYYLIFQNFFRQVEGPDYVIDIFADDNKTIF